MLHSASGDQFRIHLWIVFLPNGKFGPEDLSGKASLNTGLVDVSIVTRSLIVF